MSVRPCPRRSAKYALFGDNLDICRRLLSKAGNDYVACEEKSEYVILYTAINEVSYVKSPDGNIFPNGGFDGACYNLVVNGMGQVIINQYIISGLQLYAVRKQLISDLPVLKANIILNMLTENIGRCLIVFAELMKI